MSLLAEAPYYATCDSAIASASYLGFLSELKREAADRDKSIAHNWQPVINAALSEIREDCAVAGWDGPGSVPVRDDVLRKVALVADLLSDFTTVGIPAPDVSPSHDGEVTLSWIRSPHRLFSLSIGEHNNINYAGRLREGVEPHDVAQFDSPVSASIQQLASYISQLYRDGPA